MILQHLLAPIFAGTLVLAEGPRVLSLSFAVDWPSKRRIGVKVKR